MSDLPDMPRRKEVAAKSAEPKVKKTRKRKTKLEKEAAAAEVEAAEEVEVVEAAAEEVEEVEEVEIEEAPPVKKERKTRKRSSKKEKEKEKEKKAPVKQLIESDDDEDLDGEDGEEKMTAEEREEAKRKAKEEEEAAIAEKYILAIQTGLSGPIRIMFETLKEILQDVNMIFDKTGWKIISTDGSRVALVHLKLQAEKFHQYYCDCGKGRISIGVNMPTLYKYVKPVNNADTISLYIERNDTSKLCIKIENYETGYVTTNRLNLLDNDEEDITFPPIEFNSVMTMPSVDFQKRCRDMNSLSDTLEIQSTGNQLTLKCEGDSGSQETVIGENGGTGLTIMEKPDDDEIIQGKFPLKFLTMFTKATNLCPQTHLYIRNDFPLVLEYAVASLGSLKFFLSPNNDDIDDSDDDD